MKEGDFKKIWEACITLGPKYNDPKFLNLHSAFYVSWLQIVKSNSDKNRYNRLLFLKSSEHE